MQATDTQLEAAKAIIETRMVSQNITDYELYTDATNNRIIVRFPWRSDETDFDPEEAINELSATAQLTFREGMEYETTDYAEDGSPVYKTPTGTTEENIILEGSDVVTAEPMAMMQDQETGRLLSTWWPSPSPTRASPEVRRGHRAPWWAAPSPSGWTT